MMIEDRLTVREHEVLGLVAQGKRNRGIAKMLNISVATVENHLHSIFQKLAVTTRTEAVFVARQRGLLMDIEETLHDKAASLS